MSALPVEWVLVIFYGPSAHRATYGRLGRQDGNKTYTKDYIQLSRRKAFIDAVTHFFPDIGDGGSASLTYKWPTGTAKGALVLLSSDRPHLKWETSVGAPQVWKMAPAPTAVSAETIPGNPAHIDIDDAENEFGLLKSRGAGQPYLIAIKLRDDPNTLQLRAYLNAPSSKYAWADMGLVPKSIRDLTAKTSQTSALAWSSVQSSGTAPTAEVNDALAQLRLSTSALSVIESLDAETAGDLAVYLKNPGSGLFFDPSRNHDAWLQLAAPDEQLALSTNAILEMLEARLQADAQGDATAETLEVSAEEVEAFTEQIAQENYGVPDAHATVKTRGSAQRAFANEVKANYGFSCAVTGIRKKEFLIASHIVPWSEDQSIRLDPANGVCLSLLVDKAFEKGYLLIDDSFAIRIDYDKVGDDEALREQLSRYDGISLMMPTAHPPKLDYLQRRRVLVSSVSG